MALALRYLRHPSTIANAREPVSLCSHWRKVDASRGTWEHLNLEAQYGDYLPEPCRVKHRRPPLAYFLTLIY